MIQPVESIFNLNEFKKDITEEIICGKRLKFSYINGDQFIELLNSKGISRENLSYLDILKYNFNEVIEQLADLGAKVSWFDPLVESYNNHKSEPLNSNVDIGLIITPHSQIDFSIWKEANVKVLDLSANSKNYGWPKFL